MSIYANQGIASEILNSDVAATRKYFTWIAKNGNPLKSLGLVALGKLKHNLLRVVLRHAVNKQKLNSIVREILRYDIFENVRKMLGLIVRDDSNRHRTHCFALPCAIDIRILHQLFPLRSNCSFFDNVMRNGVRRNGVGKRVKRRDIVLSKGVAQFSKLAFDGLVTNFFARGNHDAL